MKKLTPKQRREVYLKAAELVFDGCDYLCWAFGTIIHNDDNSFLPEDSGLRRAQELLPEFELFENPCPDSCESVYWQGSDDRHVRIIGALFMAEMTKTENL